MAVKIRVLDAANRTMQRLGYLKLLCARAATFETSNLATAAACWGIEATPASDQDATVALIQANEVLRSPLGYASITDMGLLAGIRLLTEHGRLLELGQTVQLLKALQRDEPELVRFTVDRMGRTAYAKFLKNVATPV